MHHRASELILIKDVDVLYLACSTTSLKISDTEQIPLGAPRDVQSRFHPCHGCNGWAAIFKSCVGAVRSPSPRELTTEPPKTAARPSEQRHHHYSPSSSTKLPIPIEGCCAGMVFRLVAGGSMVLALLLLPSYMLSKNLVSGLQTGAAPHDKCE